MTRLRDKMNPWVKYGVPLLIVCCCGWYACRWCSTAAQQFLDSQGAIAVNMERLNTNIAALGRRLEPEHEE